MSKIANILTTSKLSNELYNIVSEKSNLIEGLPTLVIGWQNAKDNYGDFSILNWKISDNIYWTYGKRERRSEYDRRMDEFNKLVIKELKKKVKYKFINLLTIDDNVKERFLKFICGDKSKTILHYGDMLYITTVCDNYIFGVSLRDIEYQNKSVENFIDILRNNKTNNYIKEDECDICSEIIKIVMPDVYLSTKIFS